MKTIDPRRLEEQRGAGGVEILDVRTPLEFGEKHIPGSRSVPLDELSAEHVKSGRCVLVCLSGKRSGKAYEKLAAAGVEGLELLEGGVQGWESAGLPLERGAKVMSLERQVRIAAGLLVLLGVILGTWVHPGFFALSAFIGAGLTFAGITDWCGMGMLLAKAPWNRRAAA